MPSFTFTLNGNETTVDAHAGTPLLWVLRDTLGLTGTKFGCGKGLCGSCTVHIDGDAARSCITPMENVSGASVITIEGLSLHHTHPVQRAWIKDEVPQCGYCQSGQIMAAAALLKKHPNPTDAEIDESMGNMLCRCGTYQRIRRAIHSASAEGGVR
jgi:aerobic-type carbon monoxide dehydrogenase small subunit (CoxS/CutS family)